MKIRYLLPAIALLASAPAFASQCPKDIKQIDQALEQEHGLTDEQVSQVRQLRDEGEKLHQSGQHQQSVDTLAQAIALLGEK
ncbi:hypothetical protein [Sedimenticola hydrogenitrophicus]|uniref:hypothetical protein n=1 Tax=Sedimenticola hydrogenitrophicus TaxID=2967975 RepID=UPI0023AFBFAC|nr:hypothetical protein [Sedimenticola hydrogenitrophicus]